MSLNDQKMAENGCRYDSRRRCTGKRCDTKKIIGVLNVGCHAARSDYFLRPTLFCRFTSFI